MDQPVFVAADMRLRRLAVLTMLAATVIATAMVGWFVPWLQAAIEEARVSGTLSVPLACYLFLAVVALLAAPVVGFGVFAVRSGRLVIRSRQYPPPGMRVLRRTKILRGSTARLTGQGQLLLGLLLVLCGIALFCVACWGAWIIGFAGPPRAASRADAGARDLVEAQPRGAAPAPISSAALILGTPRLYDFADVATLDLIVVYLPDREPRAFATLEVAQAIDYFRERAPE